MAELQGGRSRGLTLHSTAFIPDVQPSLFHVKEKETPVSFLPRLFGAFVIVGKFNSNC